MGVGDITSVNAGTLTSENIGAIRSGLYFDGVDDYVEGNLSGVDINDGDATVLYYVDNLAPLQNWRSPALVLVNSSWTNIINVFTLNNAYFFRLKASIEYSYSTYRVPAGLNVPVYGAHVYLHSNGEVKTYYDGNLLGSQTLTINDTFSFSKFYVNYKSANNIIYFIALYNRALSDSEIKEMYNYLQGKSPKPSWWQDGNVLWLDGSSIDEANGVWRDLSKYHNDGTIYGAKKISNVGVI